MINRQVIAKYYMVKLCIIILVSFTYLFLDIVSVNFLFTAFGIDLTKVQSFMVVIGVAFLTHKGELYDHKHQHNLRLFVHDKLLRSFSYLIKSVLFLFVSFGYLVYFT